jgi:hypothetical protein
MSAGVMPDMYRHTARKSTVSKNLKSSNITLCNNNNSPTHYSTYHNDNNCKQQTIFDTIQCNIKLEKDIPQQDESFIILQDNETEQMIIGGEEIQQTNEEIIYEILEQIINEIIQSSSPIRTLSTDSQVVHNVIGSIINHFTEINNNKIEDNVNMESDQQTSIISRSRIDEDIVEIAGLFFNRVLLIFKKSFF